MPTLAHARTYDLEDGTSLTITLADEGVVWDHLDNEEGEVIGTYYRFVDEMVPTREDEEE